MEPQDVKQQGVVTHACNHNTPEPEAGGLPSVGGQLLCEFQSILDYGCETLLERKQQKQTNKQPMKFQLTRGGVCGQRKWLPELS